jgi:hypothetical protein
VVRDEVAYVNGYIILEGIKFGGWGMGFSLFGGFLLGHIVTLILF